MALWQSVHEIKSLLYFWKLREVVSDPRANPWRANSLFPVMLWQVKMKMKRDKRGETTWRCHENAFIGALGIQQPVILCEPFISWVNQWQLINLLFILFVWRDYLRNELWLTGAWSSWAGCLEFLLSKLLLLELQRAGMEAVIILIFLRLSLH